MPQSQASIRWPACFWWKQSMKNLVLPFAILLHFLFGLGGGAFAQNEKLLTCSDLKSCTGLVMVEDDCEPGCDIPMFPPEYGALPQRYISFGRDGVDVLLPLLEHRHIIVRSKAGHILSASPFLVASDSAKIIASFRAGNSWLVGAVAKVANDNEVVNLVAEGLAEPSEEFGQILRELGARADPELIRALDCSVPNKCEAAAASILESISFDGRRSELLAKHAFARAEDMRLSSEGRASFLRLAISYAKQYIDWQHVGPPDEWALVRLRALKTDPDPKVSEIALNALIGFGDRDVAGDALQLVERTQGFDRRMAVIRLGQMGPIARSAGLKLREYLKDSDWDVRVETASALAAIGDVGAAKQLEASIHPRDWLLSLRAVEALGVLDAKASEVKLLVVREAAKKAMAGAFKNARDDDKAMSRNFDPVESYCETQKSEFGLPANYKSLSDDEWISVLNSTNEKLWKQNQKLFLDHPALVGAVEIKQAIVHRGWTFVGTDNGEWGGDITATSGGKKLKLINDNSVGLYVVDDRLFAVTGLNHMMVSNEFIWRVDFDGNSTPAAELMMRTTGAADFGMLSPKGVFGLYGSWGSMLVHPSGRPEWLGCPAKSVSYQR
jgi:HEAT repeat protein